MLNATFYLQQLEYNFCSSSWKLFCFLKCIIRLTCFRVISKCTLVKLYSSLRQSLFLFFIMLYRMSIIPLCHLSSFICIIRKGSNLHATDDSMSVWATGLIHQYFPFESYPFVHSNAQAFCGQIGSVVQCFGARPKQNQI